MKKAMVVADFANGSMTHEGYQDLLIVAHRRGEELVLQNLDVPNNRITVRHDAKNEKLIFEISLRESEFFAIGSAAGVAEKRVITSSESER